MTAMNDDANHQGIVDQDMSNNMNNNDDDDDDDFQVHTSKKKSGPTQHKRVYIGGLPKPKPKPKPSLSSSPEENQNQNQEEEEEEEDTDIILKLEQDLQEWLIAQIPDMQVTSIEIVTTGKSPHALVDCGSYNANTVISKLQSQQASYFQGKKLNVQRESRPKPNNNTISSINDKKKKKKSTYKKKDQMKRRGGGGWSKPSQQQQQQQQQPEEEESSFAPMSSSDIQSIVSKEFQEAEQKGDDPINVALASTAAVALLASMNAIMLDDNDNDIDIDIDIGIENDPASGMGLVTPLVPSEAPTADTGFQIKPMSDLLADFGQEDLDWKKVQPDDAPEETPTPTPTTGTKTTVSQLAPHGKAPIYILFSSFGYKHGAPKRMEGWSHRQPLVPFDGARYFPRVPHFLEWRDGTSFGVKKELCKASSQYLKEREENENGEKHEDDDPVLDMHIQDYATEMVADQVWRCLIEAQQEGGHGYASPLEMTIYVGSESGRHRSVSICEWAAAQIRKRLRTNTDDIIKQPVSVGSFHRDVERSKQSKTAANKKKAPLLSRKTDFGSDW